MKTAVTIYFKALAIYLVLSVPAMAMPYLYLISALYASFFGWFALVLFAVIYVLLLRIKYILRVVLLVIAVVISVGFAFQMICVVHDIDDVRDLGFFLLFPAAAILSGWLSLILSSNNGGLNNKEPRLSIKFKYGKR
jgi:hypothetical protein